MRTPVILSCVLISFAACKDMTFVGKDGLIKNASVINESSGNKKLSPSDYVQWIKDETHGLKKEKTIGDIVFSAQYKPVDYIICQEERTDNISRELVRQKQSELSDMQYFDLKIKLADGQGELLKHNVGSVDDYSKRVNYFAYKMQKDIQLIDGRDTLPCALFHFERAYDVAPYSTFVLGFPVGKGHLENKTLIYHDSIFKKGIVKLEFESADIITAPELETTN